MRVMDAGSTWRRRDHCATDELGADRDGIELERDLRWVAARREFAGLDRGARLAGERFQPSSGGGEDQVVHAAGAAVELKRGGGDEGADQEEVDVDRPRLADGQHTHAPGNGRLRIVADLPTKHAIASSKAPSRSSALEPKCPITPGWPPRSWDGHLADLLSVCPVGDVRRKQG